VERFLNGLLGRLMRDLVNRAVDWGFQRATRRDDAQPGVGNPDGKPGGDTPMPDDMAEKVRQTERMMRRLGR
jgi:hypothetical protein